MINNQDELFCKNPSDPVSLSFLVPYYRVDEIGPTLYDITQLSMLHHDVLLLLYHFARYCEGDILEIGPYTGGSTIALAKGIIQREISAKIVSIEMGGSYQHETHGTDDIIRDFKKNIQTYKLSQYASLIIGNSRDNKIVNQVKETTGSTGFGMLFIDADGLVDEDMNIYKSMLRPNAYLIIDDYFAPGAPYKVKPTRDAINRLISAGEVVGLGIYGWGTWVGKFL